MQQLFIWGEGFRGYKKVKGVPRMMNSFVRNTLTDCERTWTLYIPNNECVKPQGIYKLPNELFLEISENQSILFDFIGLEYNVKIVSEDLLHFLESKGLTEGYEIAKIINVVDKSGKILKTKNYYALRFYVFDDDFLVYSEEGAVYGKGAKGRKLYPNMTIKSCEKKQIFVLENPLYSYSFIVTQEIRNDIVKKKFIGPYFYTTQEYIKAYNG